MNISIVIEWGTVIHVSAGVIACMLVYYGLFYDHSSKKDKDDDSR